MQSWLVVAGLEKKKRARGRKIQRENDGHKKEENSERERKEEKNFIKSEPYKNQAQIIFRGSAETTRQL